MKSADPSADSHAHTGPLDWRVLLEWLRADGVISTEDAKHTAKRFAAGDSRQHPLVRLGAAGLLRASEPGRGQALDVEALTEWLARRSGLAQTLANGVPRKRSPSRCELRSPASSSGKSVSPVCRPDRLQAVSPCRAR